MHKQVASGLGKGHGWSRGGEYSAWREAATLPSFRTGDSDG